MTNGKLNLVLMKSLDIIERKEKKTTKIRWNVARIVRLLIDSLIKVLVGYVGHLTV